MDLEITHTKLKYMERLDTDEFGDLKKPYQFMERIENDLDYSFYDDEITEIKKMMNPLEVIPQEGVRFSIVNIMSYCLTHFVNDYMERYTKNTHSWVEGKECLINMKNEFLFKTMLLTNVKKNYASIQELQEGNVIEGGYFDIKGLAMAKSITNKYSQKRLKEILYEDVLNTDRVDQVKIIKDLAIFEKEMFEKLRTGDKSLYKPRKIKSINAYADPMRISGFKAAIVWNEIKDNGVEGFDLEGTNNLDIVETSINLKTVEKLKKAADELYVEYETTKDISKKEKADSFIDKYNKLVELLKGNVFKGKIGTIAIPSAIATPEWVIMFINYNKIINDTLSLFPLEPLDIYTGNKHNNYTNIVSF